MNKRHTILMIYESDFGGEFLETSFIYGELNKINDFRIKRLILENINKPNIIHYINWVIKNSFKCLRVILSTKPDVIYTTTFLPAMTCLISKIFANTKTIYHYHGDRIPPKNIDSNLFHKTNQLIKYYLTKSWHDLIVYISSLVLVPSSFSKRFITRSFSKVNPKKIIIVNNGIDFDRFSHSKPTKNGMFRVVKKISNKKKMIFTVGRLNANKNFLELIDLFSLLNNKLPNKLVLVLAFPNPKTNLEIKYKTEMTTKINKLKLINSVIFIHGETHLAAYYRLADIYVSLSDIENFPLTLIESYVSGVMYCSRPVGGITRVLMSVDERLLFNSNNPEEIAKQIINILSIPEKDKKLIISKQFKLANDYNISKTVLKIAKLIYLL